MATEPIDCTGTAFESHRCVSCPDHVVVARADNAEHSVALSRTHDAYACPATAPVMPAPRPIALFHPEEALARAEHPDEYLQRVGRRADMTRNYPDQAPAWTGSRSRA
jgi:hypothetical protein